MIKLLHVEDDLDIREIAEMSLTMSGEFDLVQCEDGESALARVADYTPDIILLDMMMPGLTGIETLSEMRKLPHLKDVPVVFMTARTESQAVAALSETGAVDVIDKPFNPVTLPERIKEILSKQV